MSDKYAGYITVKQFLDSIHKSTEIVNIVVVREGCLDKNIPDYLSKDVFAPDKDRKFPYGENEYDRLVKYYGNFHVWNIVADIESMYVLRDRGGRYYRPSIVAHIDFSEIRDAWYMEKKDIRLAKRRDYYKRRKELKGRGQ